MLACTRGWIEGMIGQLMRTFATWLIRTKENISFSIRGFLLLFFFVHSFYKNPRENIEDNILETKNFSF